MENIALSGDDFVEVALEGWSELLGDCSTRLVFDRRYYGHAIRMDRWSCQALCHDHHMVYLILEGRIVGKAAGLPFILQPGMLFWLNPWTRLDMTWPDRLVFTELWFRLVHHGRNVRLPESHWVLPDAGPTLDLFHQIEQELTVDLPDSDRKRRCLLSLLTIEVTRMRSPAGRAIMSLNSPQQRRLLAYIRENLAGRPTVEDLADVVELSPDYFSRVFRQAFGVPPRDLMIRERIREAARLLSNTNLSVNQVAERLGYANVSQFSRQFRQHTGRPPRRYRLRRSVR